MDVLIGQRAMRGFGDGDGGSDWGICEICGKVVWGVHFDVSMRLSRVFGG